MNATENTRRIGFVLLAAAVALTALTGCKHYDALVFASNKQVGVKVGVDTKQIPEVSFGYNSQDFALVPVYKAGMPDGVSGNHSSVAGALRAAQATLARAETNFAKSKLEPAGKLDLRVANDLIGSAMQLAANTGEKGEQQAAKDQLLTLLKKHSEQLVKDDSNEELRLRPQITHLRTLIDVEVSKPALIAEFDPQLKYIASTEGEVRRDAYSVFGSFSGRGAVKSSGGEVKGGLAQFFATGVAAQLLASEGGAATISAEATSPAEYKYDAKLAQSEADKARLEKENESQKKAISEVKTQAELADRLAAEVVNEPNATRREQLLKTALGLTDADFLAEFSTPSDTMDDPKIRRLARSSEYYPALYRHYNR